MNNVDQGFELLKKRLLPAVLVESQENAKLLGMYCTEQRADIRPLPAQDIADVLYRGVIALYQRLQWRVMPAKLKNELESNKPQVKKSATDSTKDFVTKVKQDEEKQAYEATQADALRRINDLISGFSLIDHRTQRIAYGKTDAAKQTASNHLKKAQEKGRDLQVVAKEIHKYFDDLYTKNDKAVEYM